MLRDAIFINTLEFSQLYMPDLFGGKYSIKNAEMANASEFGFFFRFLQVEFLAFIKCDTR